MKKTVLSLFQRCLVVMGCLCATSAVQAANELPRQYDAAIISAVDEYLDSCRANDIDIHSVIVAKDGKVLAEKWLSDGNPATPHVMNSVSKTLTATAVGFAVTEGLLNLDDKVISFFSDILPDTISDNLAAMSIRDLLTMTCGHRVGVNLMDRISSPYWTEYFLSLPVEYAPGTHFSYNTLGSYILSVIIKKATGQDLHQYLAPRLYEPLEIAEFPWAQSPEGISAGGYGAYLRTDDMVKIGQLFLQKGKWKGQQIIPAEWIEMAMSKQTDTQPQGKTVAEAVAANPLRTDWLQGYGFQMWRMRNNAVRADGNMGQYILILPEQNAVIAITADTPKMSQQLCLVWTTIFPRL